MPWYDWFTSQGRSKIYDDERNKQAADAFRGALGYEGDTFTSYEDVGYDPANPGAAPDWRKTVRVDPTNSSGILADQSMNPVKMRAAADMMESGSPVGNQMAMSSYNNSIEIDNQKRNIEMIRQQTEDRKRRIAERRRGFTAPQFSPAPSPNNAPAPNVLPFPGTSGDTLSNPTAETIPPLRAAPTALPGPLDQSNRLPTGFSMPVQPSLEDQAAQIHSVYNEEIMSAPDKDTADRLMKLRDAEIGLLYGKDKEGLQRKTDTINAYNRANGLPEVSPMAVLRASTVTANESDRTPLSDEEKAMWNLNPEQTYAYDKSGIPKVVEAKKSTPTEAKQQSDIGTSLSNLYQFKKLLEGNEDLFGLMGEFNEFRKSGDTLGNIADAALNFFGERVDPATAEALSKATIIGNSVLAAVRGAAVGPEEQKMFERQLPVPGQPADKFMYNLNATIENLEVTERIKKRVNTGAAEKDYGVPVGFYDEGHVYIGGDPKEKTSWYKKKFQ